jgi:hypothetical protein
MMPEAPPFPFNSSGTLYLSSAPLARTMRSNMHGMQPQTRRHDYTNSTINSSSPPSKDSDDTSAIDSTTTSSNDDQQQASHQDDSLLPSTEIQPCSIADAPLTLVMTADLLQSSPNGASSPSKTSDEQQSTNKKAEEENN